MKKRKTLFCIIGLFILIQMGCGTMKDQDGLAIKSSVDYGKEDYKNIQSATNELGFKLLAEVEPDDQGNTFISPISLMMALSMVYNGADLEAKDEIAKALQSDGIDVANLNKANASLMSKLHEHSKDVQLDVANSIWLNEQFHFQDQFKTNVEDYFNAEISRVDMNDRKTADKINDWVKEATHKKIEKIIDSPLNESTVSILINAIYFNGSWTHKFEEKLTEERPFYLADGSMKNLPMMSLHEELAYMENDSVQAVSLPYGENEDVSMEIILPKENTSVEEIQSQLDNQQWQTWRNELTQQPGTLLLPKFKLEYETVLNEALKELGMESAFDKDKAAFKKIIQEDDPIWISQVKQKAAIDINEKGTEAAAVTSIEIKTTSAPIDQPFTMEINRPFLLIITDRTTNTNLFMGMINNL